MQDEIKELYNKDHLTQKDIIQLLLHNAQHMVTRDELKEDNRDLKADLKDDIDHIDKKIDGVEERLDKKIDDVKDELKADIKSLKGELKADIDKLDKKIDSIADRLDKKIDQVNNKFDRLQWLIVGTILTVLFKEHLLKLINSIFGH